MMNDMCTQTYLHTYMHTCIHAYMHTCISAYMHKCTHAHMHTCTHAHMHTCTHAHMHTCTHAHMDTCTHTHIHTCTHAHMHTCTDAQVHTCTHTYLYTHIPTYLHTYIFFSFFIPTYLQLPAYLHFLLFFHTYIPTYLPTYLPAYIHTYIYIHIYIYIYIYHSVQCIPDCAQVLGPGDAVSVSVGWDAMFHWDGESKSLCLDMNWGLSSSETALWYLLSRTRAIAYHQGLLAASRVSTFILYRCGSKPSKLTSFCWDEHPFPSYFRVPYLPTWPYGRSPAAPCRNPSRWDPTNGSCCGKNARSATTVDRSMDPWGFWLVNGWLLGDLTI